MRRTPKGLNVTSGERNTTPAKAGDAKRAAKRRSAKKPAKPERALSEDEEREKRALLGLGKIVDTGYGIASFPVREGQSWGIARNAAQMSGPLPLLYADRWLGGIITGLDWPHNALDDFVEAFGSMSADQLYSDPISNQKRGGQFEISDRERADEALTIRASVALQEMIGEFLGLATSAAFRAAMMVGVDVFADRPDNPEPGTWWAMYTTVPAVRRPTSEERAALVDEYASKTRALLRSFLFDSGDLVRRIGRKTEEDRNHRAYCSRERLVNSAISIYAHLNRNERLSRAKRDIIKGIIRPKDGTFSDSSWARVMKSGKAEHDRVSPDTPFCEQP